MLPESSNTLARVVKVMVRTFPTLQAKSVTRETVSSDVQGWDSLSHSMLIMGVEEEFGMELPLGEVYALADVGALVDLIDRLNAAVP
jgi:acyl carrier protein